MPVNGALTASIWLFGLNEGWGWGLNRDAGAVDISAQPTSIARCCSAERLSIMF